MRTGTFIQRGLSTLALTAVAVASAVVPAAADEAGPLDGRGFDIIVRTQTEPGQRPEFEVVSTDLGGLFSIAADPNTTIEFDGTSELMWRPGDPGYLDQWEHHTTGIETAWDHNRGSAEIVIAVLDSGVTPDPEFGSRLLAGQSFISGDPHIDPLGHGTAVASVAAAAADNETGGVGSCPECTILPVQVADAGGNVPWSAAASGIVWAVDQGADILNLSFGSQVHSQVLADAIAYAISRDVIVIAAAGNYGTTANVYPASLPDVISVAGHDRNGDRYSWSSHGEWADIAAPGCARGLYNGDVTVVCGTSFAAPWTSGATALLLTDAGPLTQAQVEVALEATTIDVDYVETGRIDASVLVGGGYASLIDVNDKVSNRLVDLAGETRGDVVQVDLIVDGEAVDSASVAGGTFSVMWDATDAHVGSHELQVAAHDSDGGSNVSRAVSVEVIEGSGFDDVVRGAFYEAGVEWMVAEGITNGTSPSTFAPGNHVTRGQLATFLYRYAGEPPVSGDTGFTDVPAGAFYADGVTWMVAQGITKGTSPTTFDPNAGVTRGQLAAFLYRYAGEPDVAAEAGFTDVARSSYYAAAVDFMLDQGITTGTGPTTYSPNSPVTRGQLATFLWRFAGEPII